MRKIFAALLMILVTVPIASITPVFASTSMVAPPLHAASQKSAVILSSLDQVAPMGQYDHMITYYLQHAGYQVTTLKNTQVTVDFLLTQLNNYNIVIWRTNTYTWKHIEYWYVGELASSGIETKYQNDFAQGYMNGNAGIVGISLNFFSNHYTSGMLTNVKLMMLISSDSESIAGFMLTAGASTVLFCNGPISLTYGQMDDLANQVFASLSMGQTIYNAVYGVVSPFVQNTNNEDPLDSSYTPPFWYQGDGTLTIT
ncbi:MAG: hypothetical protein ABSD99_01520 [Candidatus Bathyarchaeia archaeon]